MAALGKSFYALDVTIRIRSGRKQDGAGGKASWHSQTWKHLILSLFSPPLLLDCSFFNVIMDHGHSLILAPNDPGAMCLNSH